MYKMSDKFTFQRSMSTVMNAVNRYSFYTAIDFNIRYDKYHQSYVFTHHKRKVGNVFNLPTNYVARPIYNLSITEYVSCKAERISEFKCIRPVCLNEYNTCTIISDFYRKDKRYEHL